ncbi:MAG: hypothetical protein CK425_03225 [Parachlamydia sp.]|nr:MAG: hypothetical protein CK425_03225 [Parachlamydia sp.]
MTEKSENVILGWKKAANLKYSDNTSFDKFKFETTSSLIFIIAVRLYNKHPLIQKILINDAIRVVLPH